MTQADAFLAEICDSPDDDAPRLVFADWLDDHGDADRAAFIRAQVELARLPAADPRTRPLAAQAAALLQRHEARCGAELPSLPGITWMDFTRGFVEAVFAEWDEAILAEADTIFASAPIRRLQVGRLGFGAPLLRSRYLAHLTELNLGNNAALQQADVRALAASPHIRNLTCLLLHYNALGDEAVAALACSPHLRRLRELYLSGNELGDAAAVAIARSSALPALVELDLRDNHVGDVEPPALAYFGRQPLQTLWLVNNGIGPEGAWALAGTDALPDLTRLYLNYNPIGDEGAVAFACSPNRGALRELDLRHCGIRDHGALALADSPYLEGLEQLWLGGNRLRVETLARLRRRFGERLRF